MRLLAIIALIGLGCDDRGPDPITEPALPEASEAEAETEPEAEPIPPPAQHSAHR